jgi:hypothetical protein
VKAGVLGAAFFAVVVGATNAALLEAVKGSAISALQSSFPSTCSGASAQGCFSTLLSVIPGDVVLPILVAGVIFGTLYGMYYEYLPGVGYRIRAAAMGIIMLLLLLLFGLAGLAIDLATKLALNGIDAVAMIGYDLILAHFYRRFTREVRFEGPSGGKLKFTVDSKNFVGKTKTLSFHSTHKVKATEGTFHGWLVSGGVTVLDPKSPETTITVGGDGLLKAS